MDYQEAIEILHPDTTAKKLAEIEYLGGFSGREKKIEAVNEACIVACEAMKELQQYKALGTLEEVRAAVEKQKAKKPTEQSCAEKTHYKCPDCGFIMLTEYADGYRLGSQPEFCEKCGKHIDWSNTYE